jgi:hypothetical protein
MGETSASSLLGVGDQSRKCRSPNTLKMIALVAVLVCLSVLRVFIGAPDSIQESEATLDVSRERADRVELDTATLSAESSTSKRMTPNSNTPTTVPNKKPNASTTQDVPSGEALPNNRTTATPPTAIPATVPVASKNITMHHVRSHHNVSTLFQNTTTTATPAATTNVITWNGLEV